MKRLTRLLILLALFPTIASAWWSEDWNFKKKITLDIEQLKKGSVTAPEGAFALIRLHTGNFLSFMELSDQGKDIRLLAGDETTPLTFYIEKLDPVNEMALIWVKLPKEVTASPEPSLWLYFGNAEAIAAQDAPGSYEVSQVLSYQFDPKGIKDLTANANNPTEATATNAEGGLIASAAVFQGTQIIRIPPSPTLQMSPTTGWTVSAWVKIDQAQQNTVLLQRSGVSSSFAIVIKDQTPTLEVTDATDAKQEFASQTLITPGAWHNLAIAATADNLTVYLDGVAAGTFPVKLADLTSEITVGADATGGRGFSGSVDQFGIYKMPAMRMPSSLIA